MAKKLSFISVNRKCLKTTSVLKIAKKIIQQNPSSKVLIVDSQGEITKLLNHRRSTGTTEALRNGDCNNELFEKDAFFQIDVLVSPIDIDFVEFDTEIKYKEERLKKERNLISKKKSGREIELTTSEWNNIFKSRVEEDYYNLYQKVLKKYDPNYDYIIFDTPSSLGSVTCSVINVSDTIVIPFIPTENSERELIKLIRSILSLKERFNPKVKIAGLLPVLVTEKNEITTNKILLDIFRMTSINKIPFFSGQIPFLEKSIELTKFKNQLNTGLYTTDQLTESYDQFFYELVDNKIIN